MIMPTMIQHSGSHYAEAACKLQTYLSGLPAQETIAFIQWQLQIRTRLGIWESKAVKTSEYISVNPCPVFSGSAGGLE